MPAPVEEFTTIATTPAISIALEPAQSAFQSLVLLVKCEKSPDFHPWVQDTLDAMSSQERHDHLVAISGLHFAIVPQRSYASFPAYIEDLSRADPVALRNHMLDMYASMPAMGEPCTFQTPVPEYDRQAVLESPAAYLDFLGAHFDKAHIDVEIESAAYAYAIDPPAMQTFMVSVLRHLWAQYLAPEWERVKPMLKDSVSAFQELDFKGMSKLEAARLITDQEMDGCLQEFVEQARRIIFVPHAHIGPYVGKFRYPDDTLGIVFGARLPRGAKIQAPDLSRNEILVRLSALADDNRLRILKYIAEHGEQRSQDIMDALAFSQSAASRHLGLLSATGYLTERRCEGAKCYQLNPERLEETLGALRGFLRSADTPVYGASRERIKAFV